MADDEELGELQVAEYMILLLALDTYAGHVEDVSGHPANDPHTRNGIRLLRLADSQGGLEEFFLNKLTRDESKRAVKRSFRVRVSNPEQAGRRALSLRTALNRGGPATLKSVFEEARARRGVKASIAAAMLEDAATALETYAGLPVRNVRIKKWIKDAKKLVTSEDTIENPIEVSSEAIVDNVATLKRCSILEDGSTGAHDVQGAQQEQETALISVQEEATAAAKTALEISGEPDTPPTRSETIGIATAAAVAAAADAGNPANIPESLLKLDPEQRAAALTDGKVLVAAGAGAGKSTTLVSRVRYLVDERGVPSSRIMVSSFNKKAAEELKVKIGRAIGKDRADSMQVGTMHGLFSGAIRKYGTAEERSMFKGSTSLLTGSTIATAVNRLWRKCYATHTPDGMEDAEAPKARQMLMAKTKWAGNGVTPAEARANAVTEGDREAALWYEMYEGLKGAIPGWKPQCEGKAEAQREYDNFLKKHRTSRGATGSEYQTRIGDFDDMISVFKDILERSPEVRQRAQKAFDHIMIDECQDLNAVQNRVLELMTEHVTDGSDGKSFWMVGDDKQSIYAFRGARPDIFTGLDGKEGWKTRVIRTNYRCPPEVVDCANKLIAHNEDQIPMEANAAPGKSKGETSINASVYDDEASTALAVASEINERWQSEEGDIADNAILCRTNKELNSYETALLMKGIPYARKGASSFLSSPETKAFLGYITLAADTDTEKAQKALVDILNKPNRFFVGPDKIERAVDYALSNYSRSMGTPKKTVDPMVALRDPDFQRDLIFILKGTRTGFKADKGLDQIHALVEALNDLSVIAHDDEATTKDLFNSVLEMPGMKFKVSPDTGRILGEEVVTFRQELNVSIKDFGEEDEDVQEEEKPEEMGLGNIAFLFELAKPNPEDPGDLEISPETPRGFWAKMGRLQEKASELRIDLNKWEKEQDKLSPEDRRPAPGVYLGTVHCSPSDEPVLTTDGWVNIGDLDPEKHRLASYTHSCNQLFWGKVKGNHDGIEGYGFVKAVQPYKGPLLTLTTPKSKTRLTPDHRIRVKWSESFYNKYVVYLMRRGDWWRVGLAKSGDRPYSGADFKQRVSAEKADACWILSVHSTRGEAVLEEARVQGLYGITGLTFEASNARESSTEQLHALHESFKEAQTERALKLLDSLGLDKKHPLYRGQGRENDMRSAFDIQARNCLSGYMLMPVVSEAFIEGTGPREVWTKPEWYEVTVSREAFEGDVHSLVVPPHHYYVSGGAVVHNSVKGAQWPYVTVQMPRGRFPMAPKLKPGEEPTPEKEAEMAAELESERRLAYVALTRPSTDLRIVAPSQYQGKPAGMSPFLAEAGLTMGENVSVAETPKTAAFVEDQAEGF